MATRSQLDLFGGTPPADPEEKGAAGKKPPSRGPKAPKAPARPRVPAPQTGASGPEPEGASAASVAGSEGRSTTAIAGSEGPSVASVAGSEGGPAAAVAGPEGAGAAGPRVAGKPRAGGALAAEAEAAVGAGPAILPVGELARRIKGTLETAFGDVLVRGEISNLRRPGSGHLYFSLKDQTGSLRAVLFRGQARLLRFRPDNGQEVVARGRVSFYDAAGDAQLICSWLDPVGAGALALAFEQRKAKLEAEGLFDPARKRPLPFLPVRIGVVTSPTGAAIHDFVRILHRRFPGIEVLVAPARVQGAGAAEEIAAGVERLGSRGDCDVVVVTRGGGSLEDLWAFNEEVVARAIAACPVPVVSAVGHEVDFTIADFVADLRAPTPSGAAEILAPVESDLRAGLSVARSRLGRAATRAVEIRRARTHQLRARMGDPARGIADERLRLDAARQRAIDAIRASLRARERRLGDLQEAMRANNPVAKLQLQARRLARLCESLRHAGRAAVPRRRETLGLLARELGSRNPRERILREARTVGSLDERLAVAARRSLRESRSWLEERSAELRALSPLRVLARGYSIAFAASGAVLLRAGDAKAGDLLHLELSEGALEVQVTREMPSRKDVAAPGAGLAEPASRPQPLDRNDGAGSPDEPD